MVELNKDIKQLIEYKITLQKNLRQKFSLSEKEAKRMIELLEQEDVLRIEAPLVHQKPATVLIKDRTLTKSELSMTSYKLGNIIINACLDWRTIVSLICSTIGTIAGLELGHPILFWTSILGCIIDASGMLDFKLNENATAIILAIQKYNKYQSYSLSEEKCLKEANKILESYGCPVMEQREFSREISKLSKINCIVQDEGILKLEEKIFFCY